MDNYQNVYQKYTHMFKTVVMFMSYKKRVYHRVTNTLQACHHWQYIRAFYHDWIRPLN